MLQFVLLLVFAMNPHQDPSVNLLAILLGVGILQLWAWVSGGVYKNWCLDALEGSFALNLIVLAAASMFINITYVQNRIKREENKLAVWSPLSPSHLQHSLPSLPTTSSSN